MATLIWTTGFEHGLAAPVVSGGGLCDAIAGTPTVTTAAKNNGEYGLRIYTTGSAATQYISKSAAGTMLVGSFYFLWHTKPSANCRIFRMITNNTGAAIQFDATDNTLNNYIGGQGTKSGALTQDTFYRVDFKLEIANPTIKLDLQVNGSGVTQKTFSDAVTTGITGFYIGFGDAVIGECYYDDVVISYTGDDYPIGPHAVQGLRPSGDGTHNNAANIMEDASGNDINGTTYQAWTYLDENPWVSTAGADYVRQTDNGTGNWCRINFTGTTQTQILGGTGLLQYSSASATANRGGCVFVDEDGVTTTLYGASGSTADYSESSSFYKSVALRKPTGGWDQAAVNAISCLFGYSDDANPDPYWQAIMLEIAYIPGIAPTSIVLDTAGISAAGQSATIVKGAKATTLSVAVANLLGRSLTVTAALPEVDINVDTAVFLLGGQSLSVVKGVKSTSLTTAQIQVSGRAITLSLGAVSTLFDTAIIALTGQASSITKGNISTLLDTAILSSAGISSSIVVGALLLGLNTATLLISGQSITIVAPVPGSGISLDTAVIQVMGQGNILTLGGISTNLDTGNISISGISSSILAGMVSLVLDTAVMDISENALTITPGMLSLILDTAGILLGGQVIAVTSSIAPTVLTLDTATILLGAETLSVLPGLVNLLLDTASLEVAGNVLAVSSLLISAYIASKQRIINILAEDRTILVPKSPIVSIPEKPGSVDVPSRGKISVPDSDRTIKE